MPTRALLCAFAAVLVMTAGAVAAPAFYMNNVGERVTFLENSAHEVIVQQADGRAETCIHGAADRGGGKILCDGASGISGNYVRNDRSMMFLGHQWKRYEGK